MSVDNDAKNSLVDSIEMEELTIVERRVIGLFRQLSEESKSDILRFLSALLSRT